MDPKTELFEQYRSELINIAYGMLGNLSDAQDIVQDAYLRWDNIDLEKVDNPGAYLKTIVSRLCIDHFRSAKKQREKYYGPWLPEPITSSNNLSPDTNIELHEDLTIALLHLLESLSSEQRAIYLLHDIFGYKFSEVAELLNKTSAACRKAAQPARNHIRKNNLPEPSLAGTDNAQQIVQQFIQAIQERDMAKLRSLLTEDAVMYSDGGGKATAAPKPIKSLKKVSKFLISIAEKNTDPISIEVITVNNRAGLKVYINKILHSIWSFKITDDNIERIYAILNPDKLSTDSRV
jgi:RNA polymerase sigma-70 factor (ECF subfamily)